MKKSPEQQIVTSWHKNVTPWIAAIHKGEIESRLLVTNNAIIDAIVSRAPKTLLDVGCGEGWLVREMINRGIDALGVDVIPDFIAFAQQAGAGRFRYLAYENVSSATLNEQFDVVVCNFSLLGDESVNRLFQQFPSLLNVGGVLIIQTLHPVVTCGEAPYVDGWRAGSWAGFSDQFTDPAPWYFRTVETWTALFQRNGITLREKREPLNPVSKLPASIIFIGERTNTPPTNKSI
jgi:2-polyprenyl-3-methyl-5-hydroxy-6-metoxy-1,4-benzoquinol methylase